MSRVTRFLSSPGFLAILFLTAAPFVYFWKITLAQSVWYTPDIRQIYLPFGTALSRALAQGRLPFWTPDVLAGFPLLAEGHVAALYLPYLFLYRFLQPHFALSYGMIAHLAWGAAGMYLCAQALGLRPRSALLAGFLFSFNGFAVEKLYYTPILVSSSWLPWLIFCQTKFRSARLARKPIAGLWFLLTALAIGMQLLSGFPQIALLSLIAFAWFGFFGEWFARMSRFDWGAIGRALLWTVLPVALGGGIAAMQLVPTSELIGYSVRDTPMGYAFVTSYSLPPNYLAELFLPYSQSEPDEHTNGNIAYLGLAPILLAIAAPFLRRDRLTILAAVFALGALSLALGDLNPAYQLLAQLPIFDLFRTPARYLFIFLFAAILLAATGFEEFSDRLVDSPASRRNAIFVGATFTALTLGAMWFAQTGSLEDWLSAWRGLPILLAVSMAGALWLIRAHRIGRSVFVAWIVGLTVFDLACFAPPLVFKNEELRTPAYVEAEPRSLPVIASAPATDRVFTDLGVVPTIPAFRASLYPNFAMVYGRQSAQANSPLVYARSSAFLSDLSPAMANLLNIRDWLVPLEPRLSDRSVQPFSALGLDVVNNETVIPPMRVSAIELASFTEQTEKLAAATPVGQLDVRLSDGSVETFPIRVGSETADWDYERKHALGAVDYDKPRVAHSFPAFWRSYARTFDGHTYLARFTLSSSAPVVGINVQVVDPSQHLTVERITLYDGQGVPVSLAALTHKIDFALAYLSDTAAIWENPDVLPRAFVVHSAQVMNDDAAFARLRADGFRADRVALLSEGQPMDDPRAAQDRVEITRYEPERVQLAVTTDRAGYLVLTDSWYPGWNVEVDGSPAPLYRADVIFRAVPVEAGQHTVVFEYRPFSFELGVWVSTASLVLAGAIALLIYRNCRNERR